MGYSSLKNLLFVVFITPFLFLGCSTKEVFKPKKVDGEWKKVKSLDAEIIDKTTNSAIFDNGEVIVNKTKSGLKIDTNNYRIIGKSNSYILFSDINGNLGLYDTATKKKKYLHLKKTIAAASTDGNIVAVVFTSGKMALYSLLSGELLLSLDGSSSIALDSRIVNPYFMNDLVLFFTLDGKVVIVNKKLKKRLRTIIVSAEEFFNNIIYFDLFQDRLLVATATKILSFGNKQKRAQYEARSITHDDKTIYVATKQGDILSLTPNLNQIAKVHFPFAHFLGLTIAGEKLYALEKQGYLIALSKDILTYSIYKVDVPSESNVYTTKDRFFVGDKAVILGNETSK